MAFSLDDLAAARDAGLIDPKTHENLAAFLGARPQQKPASRFDLVHLLWYAGALIIISAMGLFSTIAFGAWGSGALCVTGLLYGGAALVGGHFFWQKDDLRTVGGLLIAVAVGMVPLTVFGLQDSLGLWDGGKAPGSYQGYWTYIKGGWFWMEVSTIAAAMLAVRLYPFGFILAIAGVAGWFLSMDLAAFIAGDMTGSGEFELRRKVSICVGLAMMLIAFWIDSKPREGGDMAFWLHLFGLLGFWGGISASTTSTEFLRFVYLMLNVGLMLLSVFLARRAYAVFGAMGISFYLGHLAWTVFADSVAFPFVLSGFGLALIWLGIKWLKNREVLAAAVLRHLPEGVLNLRPWHARAGQ